MSISTATSGALFCSGLTIVLCLYAIITIQNDVASLKNQIDNEIDSFKVNINIFYFF